MRSGKSVSWEYEPTPWRKYIHAWKISTAHLTFVFWGEVAPATPDRARTQGAEPRRGIGVLTQRPPEPAVRSPLIFQLWGRSSVAAAWHWVLCPDWLGQVASLLCSVFLSPSVSTDVCSDVRQLLKGHLRMKSNFYSVIRVSSSDFISLVNIYGITQKNPFVTNLGIFSIRLLWTRL